MCKPRAYNQAMLEDQPSQTAMATAAMRAAHRLHDDPLLFDDPIAGDLTSESWRETLASGEIMEYFERLDLMRIVTQIVGRARFVDDRLEESLASGATQYVLLGAGLDSFAWRRPDLAEKLRVIEVDHPATQKYKRERLTEIGLPVPPNLEFLPVDFETETLDEALRRTSFDPSARTFFAWMGVVSYLTRETMLATVSAVARCSAAGSRLVFDFPIALDLLSEEARAMSKTMDEGTAGLGESRKDKHRPEELRRDVERLGFSRTVELSPADHEALYWNERDDERRTNPQVHLIEFERSA